MKICYVSNNFEIHDYRFLKKMVEDNYEVHAVSLRKDKIDEKFKISGINYYEYYNKRKFYQKRFHGLNILWYKSAVEFLKEIVNDVKPDILHGGYTSISGFISALSGFHPFLLMPWGSDILFDPKKNLVINRIVTFSINHADMITCDAQTVKTRIINEYNYDASKIVVFPWGIDLKLFNPDNNKIPIELLEWQDKIVVICTRQMKKIYGIEYLIQAIPKLIDKDENVRFLFVGDGSLRRVYQERINDLGLNNYVKLVGFIPNNELPKYLNIADIYVSPSLSDGTSLCLLEAMACKLPVVVTEIDAIKEWIKDGYNGFTVPIKNSELLSKKIGYLIKNNSFRKKMGENNYKIASKKTDWNKNFMKLEKIYSQLQ